jgi:RHS repeat-associated protein
VWYDELSRLRTHTWTLGAVPNTASYTTSYAYNPSGCLDSMTYPSGTILTFECDAANRVTKVTRNEGFPDAEVLIADIQYHPSGQLRAARYPATGGDVAYGYDSAGRVKSVGYSGLLGLGYRYDGAGNVVKLCRDSGGGECLRASLPSARTRVMSYDAADRLQVVDWQAPGGFGQLSYDFDVLGNIEFKNGGPGGDTSFAYDDRGRLSAATGNVGALRPISLTWNKAGLLASTSTGESYWYDALGRRVIKYDGSVTYYHHDTAGRVIAETDQDGRLAHEYYYLGNQLLATHGCSSGVPGSCTVETEWYQTDMLGSVMARSDAATIPSVQGFDYLPWGEQFVAPPPSLQGDRQYNGRVFDPGTGFHDYGARLYWPEIGRFISADSVMGSPGNPMTLNRYSYVLNNPYKYVDPTGQETQLAVGLNTANNVFGHVAIIINGQVYSYGTNYTQGGKYAQDWGGDASAYLDAQASARQTQLMTLATDAGQESALKAHLDANNPNAKGAPKYDLLSNSCVTASEDALVASGVLPNQIVLPNALNTPPLGSKWAKATTPGDLGSKAKTAGIVKDSKTVGTSAGSTVQSASGTVRAASDRSSP